MCERERAWDQPERDTASAAPLYSKFFQFTSEKVLSCENMYFLWTVPLSSLHTRFTSERYFWNQQFKKNIFQTAKLGLNIFAQKMRISCWDKANLSFFELKLIFLNSPTLNKCISFSPNCRHQVNDINNRGFRVHSQRLSAKRCLAVAHFIKRQHVSWLDSCCSVKLSEKSLELSHRRPKTHPEPHSLTSSLRRLNSPSPLTVRKWVWYPKTFWCVLHYFLFQRFCHKFVSREGCEKVSHEDFASERPAFSCCLFAWHNMSEELRPALAFSIKTEKSDGSI